MPASFQVIALSSVDTAGLDKRDEPKLSYPDAYKAAESLKQQGKAFRIVIEGQHTDQQLHSFLDLGAIYDGQASPP
jgi:hypothetical protein